MHRHSRRTQVSRIITSTALAIGGLVALSASAQAQLSQDNAVIVSQSATSAADAFVLSTFAGLGAYNTSLTYDVTNTGTGWADTVAGSGLAGSYLGQALAVSYTGDSTQYAATGTVTWTSTGTYAGNAWTSVGTAIFTSTATTFSVNLSDNVIIGANQYLLNYTVPGVIGGSDIGFPGPAAPGLIFFGEAGTGTLTVNGAATPLALLPKFSLHITFPPLRIRADVEVRPKLLRWDSKFSSTLGRLSGSIFIPPEVPALSTGGVSALVLLLLGLGVAFQLRRRGGSWLRRV